MFPCDKCNTTSAKIKYDESAHPYTGPHPLLGYLPVEYRAYTARLFHDTARRGAPTPEEVVAGALAKVNDLRRAAQRETLRRLAVEEDTWRRARSQLAWRRRDAMLDAVIDTIVVNHADAVSYARRVLSSVSPRRRPERPQHSRGMGVVTW